MTTEKTCYACKRTKPLDAFCRNCAKADGLSNECKECKRVVNRKYRGKPISGRRMALPHDSNREPLYFIDEARIEAIRRLLARECKVYWLPSTRSRCPHGLWEEECAACEKIQRAALVFSDDGIENDGHGV